MVVSEQTAASVGVLERIRRRSYWIELPTCEKTVLALEPIKRIVPTTITKITAAMTAYSAMSWPLSSFSKCCNVFNTWALRS